MELLRKTVSIIMVTLLLIGMLTLAFNIQPVKSTWTGTVYIRADGSIDPPDAPIITYDNITYFLTDDITSFGDGIVIEKDNVTLDGTGHAIKGISSGRPGININGRQYIIIKHVIVKGFSPCISVIGSKNCIIKENDLTTNGTGIQLGWSYTPGTRNNTIYGNTIRSGGEHVSPNCIGISVGNAYANIVKANKIVNMTYGIRLGGSAYNNISDNTFINCGIFLPWYYSWYINYMKNNTVNGKPLVYLYGVSDYEVADAGQVILVNCFNITVKNLDLASYATVGIELVKTQNSTIINNIVTNQRVGIYLCHSPNNTVSENKIENCISAGIEVWHGKIYYWSLHPSRSNNIISRNRVTNCSGGGVYLEYSTDNVIDGNGILNCATGIGTFRSPRAIVTNNYVEQNQIGILIGSSSFSKVTGNNIRDNSYGIDISDSSGSSIFHNNFMNNTIQVYMPWGGTHIWDNGYPSGGNYWSDYTGDDNYSGPNQDQPGSDGIGDTPYIIDDNNVDRYPLMNPWTPTPPIQIWLFDSDFQYNLDDNYGTVEGTGHLGGTATLSAGSLSIEGQITINGPLPSAVPEVYLIATDGPDEELARQAVDLSGFSYWQTGINTYNFSGHIPNVIQPINNGHYEVSALITYNAAKYEFFVNTASLINNHYFPLTPTPPPKFMIGDWVQTTANLNVREGPGLSYSIIDTVPVGTVGQIIGGPVEADGYIWWEVNYAVEIRGWSAENWLEPYPQPICVVKLQKDGVEINEVGIWEFFDIYVGNSKGDKLLKAVRFSSDDTRDGYPTGEWTEWYDWDISSEDWDATTKIKRWAFATPGYKEVWAEVKDERGHTAVGCATIFVPAASLPVLISPLLITPVKDIYEVGDVLEAEFTIKNVGDTAITLDVLTVAGRLNGFIPPEGAPDFTFHSVTLQPNESYHYQGTLTLNQTGNYHFFVAYYIENPTPEQKRLLDENNWNTCVELGEGLTHKDRVKNIIVYKEGTVPEEVSKLNKTINRWIDREIFIPAYLIDPEVSWAGSVWMTVSSVWTHAQERYDELWLAGVDYGCMSKMEAIYAKRFLERGDIESAKKHLQKAFLYDKVSYMFFNAATEVFDRNMQTAMQTVKSTLKMIEFGVSLLNPTAGKFASYVFMIPNYIADSELVGENQSIKNLVVDAAFKAIFSEYKYPELGERTLEDYLTNRVGKLTFPVLQEIFKENEALQFHLSHVLKKIAAEEAEWLSKKIVDELSKQWSSLTYKKFSPIELRVYDSEGKITGVVNGSVRHEISQSFYRNGMITILFPSDSYTCEIVGKEEGTYGLEISFVEAWNATMFNATGIPVSASTIHQYIVNWDALSRGEEGVTVKVDSDGDGVFEHTFTSDCELTQREYVIATDDIPPRTWLNIGEPKLVVNNVTYLTSATPIALIAEDDPGGSDIALTAYRIYNASYDSGWITYTQPFNLTGLSDGVYKIDYNSTDCAGNVELTNTATIILFSWQYIYEDAQRGTTLKINTDHKLFQFITADKDFGIRQAATMYESYVTVYCDGEYVSLPAIIIRHNDGELRLLAYAGTEVPFCYARALDYETAKRYILRVDPTQPG